MRLGGSAASRQEQEQDDGVDPSRAELLTHYVSLRRLSGCSAFITAAKSRAMRATDSTSFA